MPWESVQRSKGVLATRNGPERSADAGATAPARAWPPANAGRAAGESVAPRAPNWGRRAGGAAASGAPPMPGSASSGSCAAAIGETALAATQNARRNSPAAAHRTRRATRTRRRGGRLSIVVRMTNQRIAGRSARSPQGAARQREFGRTGTASRGRRDPAHPSRNCSGALQLADPMRKPQYRQAVTGRRPTGPAAASRKGGDRSEESVRAFAFEPPMGRPSRRHSDRGPIFGPSRIRCCGRTGRPASRATDEPRPAAPLPPRPVPASRGAPARAVADGIGVGASDWMVARATPPPTRCFVLRAPRADRLLVRVSIMGGWRLPAEP